MFFFCWEVFWMGTKDLIGTILLSWNNLSYVIWIILSIFWYPVVRSCFSLSGSAKCYWLSMAFLELNLGRGLEEPVWVQMNGGANDLIFLYLPSYWSSEISITYPNLWVHLLLDLFPAWWQLKDLLFSPRTLGKISNLTNIFQMPIIYIFSGILKRGNQTHGAKA